jgi:hypothetical protein
MLSDLPELVRRLRRQGRRIGLIDGLGREAYTPDDRSAAVDDVLTPYVLEPGALARNADMWRHGPNTRCWSRFMRSAPDSGAMSGERASWSPSAAPTLGI